MVNQQFLIELKKRNIIWVTPDNEEIIQEDALNEIFNVLTEYASTNKNKSFGALQRINNVRLVTNEVVEAVVAANYVNGAIQIFGIFLYDYTTTKYADVKALVSNNFWVQTLN